MATWMTALRASAGPSSPTATTSSSLRKVIRSRAAIALLASETTPPTWKKFRPAGAPLSRWSSLRSKRRCRLSHKARRGPKNDAEARNPGTRLRFADRDVPCRGDGAVDDDGGVERRHAEPPRAGRRTGVARQPVRPRDSALLPEERPLSADH